VSDLVRGHGELRRAGRTGSGRHAVDDDAVLTPIFHALSRGGVRSRGDVRSRGERSRGGDEVAEFRRDPLTAPIPLQVLVAAAVSTPRRTAVEGPRRRRAAHALTEPRGGGRHALLAG
jgi:hypothetical protein